MKIQEALNTFKKEDDWVEVDYILTGNTLNGCGVGKRFLFGYMPMQVFRKTVEEGVFVDKDQFYSYDWDVIPWDGSTVRF